LAQLVEAAHQYPKIREYSTMAQAELDTGSRVLAFNNTNTLVKNPQWQIGLSKTGYISEAGRCLVMQVWVAEKPLIMVLLDSTGKMTRVGDASRIKRWIESVPRMVRRATDA
jgi:D-alanyl-D-alanine endopeptidase (penicillin-binding protein 7)